MPNFTKKVYRVKAAELHPGEEVLGATYGLPPGEVTRMVSRGVAGVIGSVAAKAATRKSGDGDEAAPRDRGLAGHIPSDRGFVLAVTPLRLLVYEFGQMKGIPKDLVAEYPLSDLSDISAEKMKLVYRVRVDFADGTAASFDVQRMAKPMRLVDGYRAAIDQAGR